MIDDDNDGQMIFGGLGGRKLPDICLIGEEKPRINLTQETCPDRGSNPGPLRDRRTCYHLTWRVVPLPTNRMISIRSSFVNGIPFELVHLPERQKDITHFYPDLYEDFYLTL